METERHGHTAGEYVIQSWPKPSLRKRVWIFLKKLSIDAIIAKNDIDLREFDDTNLQLQQKY